MLSDNVLCADLASEIKYWNSYYEVYDKCLKSFAKKNLSESEFREIILKHTTEGIVDTVIAELKEKNIIDDMRYKKMFISTYEDNLKYSSTKINEYLNDLNIYLTQEELDYLRNFDYDKACKIVISLCSKTKNKSKYEMINACKIKLQTYKYDRAIIEEAVKVIEYDEKEALKLLFNKLLRRNDVDKVIKKLYSKGYSYELIMEVKEDLYD